jgi:beta-glucosidase
LQLATRHMKRFPDDFTWGAATSAFQIEGAVREDGRGESIWDRFAAEPGRISDGSDASVACDHYHRTGEDVEILRWLGVRSYRFSVAWPRVLPTGRGAVNEAGLDFYDRLVDALLAAGIEPFLTLNHWDLPQALHDAGGWPARDTVDAFVRYAGVVMDRLGDRVPRVCTHNEPWCISTLGFGTGEHAPGEHAWPRALAAAHHLLLSHGLAVDAIRAVAPAAEVGIVLNLVPAEPASASRADHDACRAFDGSFNRWFLDPLYGRGYPADVIEDHRAAGRLGGGDLSFVHDGDLAAIATPTDFLGVNYYSRAVMRSSAVPEAENAPPTVVASDDKTEMGWEVAPGGLLAILRRVHADYAPPRLYIAENGAAYGTAPDAEGRVRDVLRQRYLWTHFEAAHQAIAEGVPLAGFYLWSLLDNFEWAQGYTKRFGLFWVDYATQERIAKDSAHMCRRIIRDNALASYETDAHVDADVAVAGVGA